MNEMNWHLSFSHGLHDELNKKGGCDGSFTAAALVLLDVVQALFPTISYINAVGPWGPRGFVDPGWSEVIEPLAKIYFIKDVLGIERRLPAIVCGRH